MLFSVMEVKGQVSGIKVMKEGMNLKKKKRILIAVLLTLFAIIIIIIIIIPPILAPLVHNNASPKSAIREEMLKDGHPYQSFFALITENDYQDKVYGQLYNVHWYDYDNPTGDTATFCYTTKNENENYEVSCGTGP